ncbi:helix-turn-helix domain-containing protein [Streptomyces sp. NPDC059708]|uniref:helix-turn-helix domain-containing protein n=1 Tax=Streptomyces sp. NPDC059708 TaxID=3346916 RepID=UPI0036950AC2
MPTADDARAAVETSRLGRVTITRIHSAAPSVVRSEALAAREEAAHLVLLLQERGTPMLLQEGGRTVLGEGDLILRDTARPYSLHSGGPSTTYVLRIPRTALGLSDGQLGAVARTAFATSGGPAGLLASVIPVLAASPGGYTPRVADRLAENLIDLLALLVTEHLRPTAAAGLRASLAGRIRDHIDRNLAEPALSPESIARAHHVSVRYLHRVFEGEDTTVGRLIQRRRVEQCARELARPGAGTVPVAAIAHRWGFANAGHFSRVFRHHYGCTPLQWRNGARTPAP